MHATSPICLLLDALKSTPRGSYLPEGPSLTPLVFCRPGTPSLPRIQSLTSLVFSLPRIPNPKCLVCILKVVSHLQEPTLHPMFLVVPFLPLLPPSFLQPYLLLLLLLLPQSQGERMK